MKIVPVSRKGARPLSEQSDRPRPDLTLAVNNDPKTDNTRLTRLMDEIERLQRESERLRGRIRQLEDLADTDALLPIFNRRAFTRELMREIALADRHREPMSLVFIDLNGFKAINDTYSHAAGDAVLVHVASLLRSSVRESDIVGRLGGDEFGVILHRSEYEPAVIKARSLAARIAQTPTHYEGHSLAVGAAAGVVAWRKGETAEDVLGRADAAMYAHKRCGREAG